MSTNIPYVEFMPLVMNEEKPSTTPVYQEIKTTHDYFKNKRIVLFSLPGAFTPTCSEKQLPEYEKHYKEFLSCGVDEVYCLSVNDPFVMHQWGLTHHIKNVKLIPDGNGEFTGLMGMLLNATEMGLGKRSWRYSMLVENEVIQKKFVEKDSGMPNNNDPYEVSDPKTMLNFLLSS